MKICVVDFAASEGGALSILRDFYTYIKNYDTENEWVFLLSDNYIKETDKIKVILLKEYKASWLKRLKFDYKVGAKIINDLKCDCIFNLQNTFVKKMNLEQTMYIHQSLPFQNVKKFSFFKREEMKMAIYQKMIGFLIKGSVKKGSNIIVQTEWMKESIVEKGLSSAERVSVIPPVINIKSSEISYEYENNKFFYPAGEYIYKNHKVISEAMNILESNGNSDFEVGFTISKNEALNKNIKFLGMLPREEVYQKFKSETLIFPSYIETYGLPLAECRTNGGLILAADTPFAREVLDGYKNAYFFKYDDANELAALMGKVLNGEIKKLEVEEANRKCKSGSWRDVIDIIVGRR